MFSTIAATIRSISSRSQTDIARNTDTNTNNIDINDHIVDLNPDIPSG
jgi:hypothetical protein